MASSTGIKQLEEEQPLYQPKMDNRYYVYLLMTYGFTERFNRIYIHLKSSFLPTGSNL